MEEQDKLRQIVDYLISDCQCAMLLECCITFITVRLTTIIIF